MLHSYKGSSCSSCSIRSIKDEDGLNHQRRESLRTALVGSEEGKALWLSQAWWQHHSRPCQAIEAVQMPLAFLANSLATSMLGTLLLSLICWVALSLLLEVSSLL